MPPYPKYTHIDQFLTNPKRKVQELAIKGAVYLWAAIGLYLALKLLGKI